MTNATAYTDANLFPQNSHSGANFANLAGVSTSSQQGSLSQSLTTVVGQKYTLSFWLADDASSSGSTLTASLGTSTNTITVADLPDGSGGGSNSAPYQLFTVSPFTATSTSTLLSFTYQTDLNWALDDVVVQLMASGPTAAPEMDAKGGVPALALSIFLAGVLVDRRRKNS